MADRATEFSPELQAFLAEYPRNRPAIARFVAQTAARLEPGARVLDAGAGEAPYRELFSHCEYVTSDWGNSWHPGAKEADIIAPIDDLPVEDGSFDAVICTEVLEHVARPRRALRELGRVLAGGGRIHITVPFVWALHEEPYDFQRFTAHGLEQLLTDTGFTEIEVRPLTGYLATLGQVLQFYNPPPGGSALRRLPRRALARAVQKFGGVIGRFDRGHGSELLPLGYCATAVKRADNADG
ncbi:unannotated protein [freshwater metagenome]|uniref:Unannotated protein n=1 Tax=freshwater metagenome TaxID=449393 RepID=A0A6J7DAJ7_9ZZZZ|nr:methyltransferase domain-containing protein [Actinomycetota bacterium]